MKLNNLDRIEQKRALYIQGAYFLMQDSLKNEVINPLFQAIDNGLYHRLQNKPRTHSNRRTQHYPKLNTAQCREDNMIKGLLSGNVKKVVVRGF